MTIATTCSECGAEIEADGRRIALGHWWLCDDCIRIAEAKRRSQGKPVSEQPPRERLANEQRKRR